MERHLFQRRGGGGGRSGSGLPSRRRRGSWTVLGVVLASVAAVVCSASEGAADATATTSSTSLRGQSSSTPLISAEATSPPGLRKKRRKAIAGDDLPPIILPPKETLGEATTAQAPAAPPAADSLAPPSSSPTALPTAAADSLAPPPPSPSLPATINNSTQPAAPAGDGTYTPESLLDEITQGLPGLKEPIDFRQFSGYLPITDSKNIFYWYVEAVHNPETAPLVFWTNGGPGCSGLYGLMAENGPVRPLKDGATLVRNAYSWNRVANMLYVEQPVTVGFSYTTEDLDNKAAFGDDQAALDNYRVIQTFLARFPHLRLHDLYLSGESYSGHYLPSLARFILDKNQEASAAVAAVAPAATAPAPAPAVLPPSPPLPTNQEVSAPVAAVPTAAVAAPAALPPSPPSKDQTSPQATALPPSLPPPPPKINLRGFLVGNPSTDPVLQLIGQVDTLHSRHLLPPALYERWTTQCASTPTVAHLGSTACVQIQRQVLEAVKDYDVYSISTPPCPILAAGDDEASISSSSSSGRRSKSATGAPTAAPAEKKKGGRGGGGGFYLLANDEYWAGLLRLEQGNTTSAAATAGTVGNSSTTASGPPHHRHLRSSAPSPSPSPPTPPSLLPSFPTSPPLPYESCQALYGANYLNRLDVKAAIHAKEWVSWEDCSSLVLDNYQRSDWSLYMEPTFKSLFEGEAGREGGGEGQPPLRVLLYSGEDDTVCSSKGTEMWLETLGWTTVEEWAPWSVREGGKEGGRKGKGKAGKAAVPVVAGMKKKYENGVVFATVNGAGHAVPSFKPREALYLFQEFLEGRL